MRVPEKSLLHIPEMSQVYKISDYETRSKAIHGTAYCPESP